MGAPLKLQAPASLWCTSFMDGLPSKHGQSACLCTTLGPVAAFA